MQSQMMHVNLTGVRTEDEKRWADRVWRYVFDKTAKFCNNTLTPVYNWVWDNVLGCREESGSIIDNHPNYLKGYFKIANFVSRVNTVFYGLDLYNKRRVIVNMDKPSDGDDFVIVKNLIF